MNILSAQNLTKIYGEKLLFGDLTLGIGERDRIGVIGINGTGKSTLLKVLCGLEPLDGGLIAKRENLRIAYLAQNPEYDPQHTVREHIFALAGEVADAVGEYEEVQHALAHAAVDGAEHEPLLKALDRLTHRLDALAGWDYEARAQAILGKLGITDLTAKLGTLSGGQRKRVALAHVLLAEPELLVLDEPTNHLDVGVIEWLEGVLERYPGAVLLVTHDRYFLNEVTRRIVELDGGALRTFEGNFQYYLERKADLMAAAARSEERRQSILRTELAWIKRGARARTTKQQARIQRFDELAAATPERPQEKMRFELASRRLGKKIVELERIHKTLGGLHLVNDFSHHFTPGERVGILGPNGCGKSTLANLITGRLAPDAGNLDVGLTVAFGYYDQDSAELDPAERTIDYVKREGGELLKVADGSVLTAPQLLERFQFTPTMLYAPVGKLSGGERRRLYLVTRLLRDPNFLVLDEPTNDLDLATLEALEDFLDGFGGCLLVISHDRYFLDRTVDRVFAPTGGGHWKLYPGSYTVYARMREEEEAEAAEARAAAREKEARRLAAQAPAEAKVTRNGPRKLSYKEQRELEQIEAEIPQMEQRIEALNGEIGNSGRDYEKLRALTEEQGQLTARLEMAMARWEELLALANG